MCISFCRDASLTFHRRMCIHFVAAVDERGRTGYDRQRRIAQIVFFTRDAIVKHGFTARCITRKTILCVRYPCLTVYLFAVTVVDCVETAEHYRQSFHYQVPNYTSPVILRFSVLMSSSTWAEKFNTAAL